MSITGSEQWMYSSGREFYDFPIEQSLRFNDNDSAYLSRTPASAGNRKTWTFSAWVKRGNLGSAQMILAGGSSDTDRTIIRFGSSDNIEIDDYTGTYNFRYITNAVFRDVSSFYNITVVADISNATTTERVRLYVNGERITSFSTESTPLTGINTRINNNVPQQLGKHASGSNQYYDGYMAEINFVDGTALDPTSFGEFKSGIWIPKDTADLTFGTNGFRLEFGDTTEASGFNTVTYRGNGSSQSVSGVGFSSSPDFVWIKERTSTSSHILVNSVRGANKLLSSNTADSEQTDANKVASLDADGFSLGSSGAVNQSSQDYVAWCWDAGSGSSGSNTDGTITSTVKANQTYGFSVLHWTGTATAGTVGHGLSSAPEMIIAKNGSAGDQNWQVYHASVGSTFAGQLQSSTAFLDRTYWNDTDPTSSVFSISGQDAINESGNTIIAYAFHSVTGYSKFGSFTGTGAAGNSITTGFKPAFVLWKSSTANTNWTIADNTRDTSNPINKRLLPNLSNAEDTSVSIDFNDTGFEFNSGQANDSGETFIYMAFTDTRNAAFWRDTSGQSNDWQPNNLVFSDVVPDSTTNNFAVLNPLDSTGITSSWYIEEGNTAYTVTNNSAYRNCSSTFFPENLKGYFEWSVVIGTPNFSGIGMYPVTANPSSSMYNTTTTVYCKNNGNLNTGSTTSISSMLSSFSTGDVGMCAFDFTGGTRNIWFGKNGSWGIDGSSNTQDPANGNNPAHTFSSEQQLYFASNTGAGTQTIGVNFGQDSTFAGARAAGGNADENGYGDFAYAPPSGFLSLCSANLPSGAIDTLTDETPEDYFNTALYTGNGGTQSITGVNFQPSLTWIKSRSAAYDHVLIDAVRGVEKQIISNKTDAESQDAGKGLTSFDSDGFTVTLGTSTSYNNSSQTYAAWNWKAGGSGVSNTDGSITSTVSVGATSQQNWFSVVSWTGTGANATIGHGLNGAVPELILLKNRNDATNWTAGCTHYPSGWQNYQRLNDTSAVLTASSVWNDTAPTTSVFSVGTSNTVNGSGDGIIAYCFANAEGLCKVGSYTGNGNTGDGTFVYTGFRPSFLLIKRTDAVDNWPIEDNERNPSNLNRNYLLADTSGAEGTVDLRDFLSNGFKMRGSAQNASGGNYIYLAIASQPFKYANAR